MWVRVCCQMILTQTSEKVEFLEPFACWGCGSGLVDLYHLPVMMAKSRVEARTFPRLYPGVLGCLSCVSRRACPNPPPGAPVSGPSRSAPSPAQLTAAPCLAPAKNLHAILEPTCYLWPCIQSISNPIVGSTFRIYPESGHCPSLLLPSSLATVVSHG